MSHFPPQVTPRTEKRARHIYDHYFIGPCPDGKTLEIWAYSDKITYKAGETVHLHVSTTGECWDLEVARDGAWYDVKKEEKGIQGQYHPTPEDASAKGCAWPAAYSFTIPDHWTSGVYLVTLRAHRGSQSIEEHHLFIIRAGSKQRRSPYLLLCATPTWVSYNCWGGSNSYEGITGPNRNQFSPKLSLLRPWTRGFCKLPQGAPRAVPETPPKPGDMVRYPYMEWAYAYGYSKKYASAGWASYERPFALWAEKEGFALDYACLHDLDVDPSLLDGYDCAIIVGHDEYWSTPMRDAMDNFVDHGGNAARFAGNFFWQVRIEDNGTKQVTYKMRSEAEDPMHQSQTPELSSGIWDFPPINRPGTETFGASGAKGIYAGLGNCVGRGSGGYQIYRPNHWAFKDAHIGYGDILGAQSRIIGYEVDGLDYEMKNNRPVPSTKSGASPDIEILGLCFASMMEVNHEVWGEELYIDDHDLALVSEELKPKMIYGNGAMVAWEKGQGQIFNAATCEWVAGLIRQDMQVEQVTRNVLRQFGPKET